MSHLPEDDRSLADVAGQAASASSGNYPHGLLRAVPVSTSRTALRPDGTVRTGSRTPPRDGQRQSPGTAVTVMDEEDEGSFFQVPAGLEERWQNLMEMFWAWFEEGRAVGMAVQMLRSISGDRGGHEYQTWVALPLETLAVGIPASSGIERGLTPLDFRHWAEVAERILYHCFLRDREQGVLQMPVQEDTVSLMENRYRSGRRRIRDSRSPRRSFTGIWG